MNARIILLIFSFCIVNLTVRSQNTEIAKKPYRVGIVGLVHDHVGWILDSGNLGDIQIVGIAEPNKELAESYSKKYGYNMNIVYGSIDEMIAKTKPEAVFAYNPTFDHLKTVEYCAPRGIHVMVEKPLAVNPDQADKMVKLAEKNNIYLITNYETSWYGSNKSAWEIINDKNEIGPIRKIVFHTGHQGPAEIGCSPQFLEWLTDPVLNGGGTLEDFGCYGANLCTWLLKGETPLTVTAVTQQIKPEIYPKVEDEATIILTYPKTQVIIQASWNWPYGRKDMEIYGEDGYLFCLDRENMLLMKNNQKEKKAIKAPPMPDSSLDQIRFFLNLVRGTEKMGVYDLSAPANNEIVVKILEAAKFSAKSGTTVIWEEFYKNN